MFPGETVLSGAPSSTQNPHVSAFKVMHSSAGYYVGTSFLGCDCDKCKADKEMIGMAVPNTRETGYFAKELDAQAALDNYNRIGVLSGQRT